MSNTEMIQKIEELKEWEALIEEASAEAESIKDEIKREMLAQGAEEMSAGAYIVRYTSVLSSRFDTTKFKQFYADLYKEFTKQTASRRFSISA